MSIVERLIFAIVIFREISGPTCSLDGSQGWTRLFEQLFRVDKWSICRG